MCCISGEPHLIKVQTANQMISSVTSKQSVNTTNQYVKQKNKGGNDINSQVIRYAAKSQNIGFYLFTINTACLVMEKENYKSIYDCSILLHTNKPF